MIIDCSVKLRPVPEPIMNYAESVVKMKLYLGFVIDSELKDSANMNMVVRECNQRPHFFYAF